MDLAFTPEELAFRDEIRAWVKDNLPADISHKVHNALRLSRDERFLDAYRRVGPAPFKEALYGAEVKAA